MTSPVICFSVSCTPVPQPRQRHRVVRSGPKAYATNYTPAKHPVNGFKTAVALAGKTAMHNYAPFRGPLEVRIKFRFPLPASAKACDKRYVASGADIAHFSRFDIDNLCKSLFDCLTGICWGDDRQISKLIAEKVYTKGPGVDVWMAEWRL